MALLLNNPVNVSEDHFLLKIEVDESSVRAGQFVNIKTTEGTDPLLRRPFSIFDAEGSTLSIIVRVIGKGTGLLSEMKAGDINVIGPTGNGFTVGKGEKVLLVGGGVGNAPLYLLMKELKKAGNSVSYIYCARNTGYVFEKEKYAELADEFFLTTDDGSDGIKGFATEVLADKISASGYDRIYCCGPDPMMRRVVELAEKNTPVEVSVENYFGCGVGICVGCTVDTVSGYKRACIDGPVLDGRSILWDKMPD